MRIQTHSESLLVPVCNSGEMNATLTLTFPCLYVFCLGKCEMSEECCSNRYSKLLAYVWKTVRNSIARFPKPISHFLRH